MSFIQSKKGFVFSFLAIFLVIVIFAFAYFNLDRDDYASQEDFVENRILTLESEINYFKDVYLKSSVEYSFLKSVEAVINKSYNNDTAVFYSTFEKNHSKLNEYLFEAMINGSLNGEAYHYLKEGRTFINLTEPYFNNFADNYGIDASYNITGFNVFEQSPYFISLQLDIKYSFESQSDSYFEDFSWNFSETEIIVVPVIGLYNPEFILTGGVSKTDAVFISPVEQFQAVINWDLDQFNASILENTSQIQQNPNFKYTLGTSFLNSLLNISEGLYYQVQGFWSFDYDIEEDEVYDSSVMNYESKSFANSRILLDFDYENVEFDKINDSSDYNNAGFYSGVDCTTSGVFNTSCTFDSINDLIFIRNNASYNLLNITTSFSISFWFSTNSNLEQRLLEKGGFFDFSLSDYIPGYYIRLNESFSHGIDFRISDTTNTQLCTFIPENTNYSNFHHLVLTVSKENQSAAMYFDSRELAGDCDLSSIDFSQIYNSRDLTISNETNPFIGRIDEFGLYSKELSLEEISTLFGERRVFPIDYSDSLYGLSHEFDGVDDYVVLSKTGLNYSGVLNEFTVEAWIYPTKFHENHTTVVSKGNLTNVTGQGDFGLKFRANSMDVQSCDNSALDHDIRFFVETNDIIDPITILCWGNLSKYLNQWNYFVGTYNGTNTTLYWNGVPRVTNRTIGLVSTNSDLIQIGHYSHFNLTISEHFEGRIDEVKISNYSIDRLEVERRYLNYNSAGKGCCNYMTLINPNKLGYTGPLDDQYRNLSYSSKLFFDDLFRGRNEYNLTLYNVTNITSQNPLNNFYNFQVDLCVLEAYQIFDYPPTDALYPGALPVRLGAQNSCEDLIRVGIY